MKIGHLFHSLSSWKSSLSHFLFSKWTSSQKRGRQRISRPVVPCESMVTWTEPYLFQIEIWLFSFHHFNSFDFEELLPFSTHCLSNQSCSLTWSLAASINRVKLAALWQKDCSFHLGQRLRNFFACLLWRLGFTESVVTSVQQFSAQCSWPDLY